MLATVNPIYKDKLDGYDKAGRMRTTKQGTGCKYFTN